MKFAPYIERLVSVPVREEPEDAKSIIHLPINSRRCSLSHDAVAAGLSDEESEVCLGRKLLDATLGNELANPGPRMEHGRSLLCTVRWRERAKE